MHEWSCSLEDIFSNNGTNADSSALSTTDIICSFNYLLTLIMIEQQDLACNVL